MITGAITQWFLNIIRVLFSEVDFSASWPFEFLNIFRDYLDVATYFFPLDAIRSIIFIILMIQTWRILSSFIQTIWALLPFL